MFALAVRWGMCEANPCKGIEKNKEYHRRRYLKFDELTALLKALAAYSDQRIADVFRLLLMTGARRGEVLSMRWADLELGNAPDTAIWSKPPASTKQKEQHEVPLSGPARQLLMEARQRQAANRRTLPEFVFNGSGQKGHVVEVKRAWRSICKVAGITNLRIHDLRHSFASQAISDGASLPLVGALLGHFNPSTTQRYAHMLTDPQRRTVENVGAVITAAANGGPSTEPTPFKRTPSKRRRS
jgi:integrase